MSKEAAGRPIAEELAHRMRPLRPAARAGIAWLRDRRALVAALLCLGALLAGATAVVLRQAPSFSRRSIAFPPPPKLDASLAAAQERLKADPQDIGALVDLGTLHFQKGKDFYPDAINELEQAREFGAMDTRIFYCLGIMYQEVGLYPFALEEYKRFLRHYPDDKEIRLLEAKLLYKQGRYPEAVSEYERLKFRYPNDSLVQENLGLSLWGAKDLDHAVETLGTLKSMGQDQSKRAEFYLGQIALQQGQAQPAFDHLAPLQGAGDFGIAQYQLDAALAAAQQKLGRAEEAKALWQKVLVENPDDSAVKDAKTALRQLGRRGSSKKRRK